MNSLREETLKDDLQLDVLQQKVQECMNSYQFPEEQFGFANDPADQSGSANKTHMDGGERRLQFDGQCITLPGFFLEGSAIFQFTYGLGLYDFNGTSLQFHDMCIGGGPTVGTVTRP